MAVEQADFGKIPNRLAKKRQAAGAPVETPAAKPPRSKQR